MRIDDKTGIIKWMELQGEEVAPVAAGRAGAIQQLIDARHTAKLATILTTNRTMDQIEELLGGSGPAVVSRLKEQLVIEMNGEDYRVGRARELAARAVGYSHPC